MDKRAVCMLAVSLDRRFTDLFISKLEGLSCLPLAWIVESPAFWSAGRFLAWVLGRTMRKAVVFLWWAVSIALSIGVTWSSLNKALAVSTE